MLDACARLLALSDLGIDEAEGRRRAEAAVADGSADVDVAALDRGAGRHRRRGRAAGRAGRPARSRRRADGYVAALGAIGVGNAAVHLGAGRRTKEDEIDHAVGVVVHAKRGDACRGGRRCSPRSTRATDATRPWRRREVLAAYELGDESPRRASGAARGRLS